MRHYIRIAALIAIAALVPSAPLLAQSSGTIRGTVDDDGGAPVAGAAVSIAGPVRETSKTDASGGFAFTGLPNGQYDIAVSKGGYQTSASSGIVVSSSTPVTLAIVLHVASFFVVAHDRRREIEGRLEFQYVDRVDQRRDRSDVRAARRHAGDAGAQSDPRHPNLVPGRVSQRRGPGRDHLSEHPRRAFVRNGDADRRPSAVGRLVRRLRDHVFEPVPLTER
jgi:hypothetical protein